MIPVMPVFRPRIGIPGPRRNLGAVTTATYVHTPTPALRVACARERRILATIMGTATVKAAAIAPLAMPVITATSAPKGIPIIQVVCVTRLPGSDPFRQDRSGWVHRTV